MAKFRESNGIRETSFVFDGAEVSPEERLRRRMSDALVPEQIRNVLRREDKYLIGTTEYAKASDIMSRVLTPDSHNRALGYTVRSLYFDTVYDSDYEDKLDGAELRRKIRLRVYGPDYSSAYLEMKQKQGALQRKRAIRLDAAAADEIIHGNLRPLLESKTEFALECYGVMRTGAYCPKAVVQYDRTAYTAKENDTRVTFDRNIAATSANFDIFDEDLCLYPVLDRGTTVMEVKYNGFLLEYIKMLTGTIQRSTTSLGKYYLARVALK